MSTQRSVLELIINAVKKGKGLEQTAKDTEKLEKAQKGTSRSSEIFNLALGSLATTAAGVALAFAKQIPELLDTSFQYRNAKIALDAYAGSAFEAERITEAVTRAAGGAVDQFAATQNATKLFSLGLADNAEQAEKLTKIAITLGATMGRDAKGAFEDFTLLLANQSILRLDTFGISGAKVREEMERLAKEFPELDRQTRFLNATMDIAGVKMEQLEAAGFQATSSMDRLKAEITNLKLEAADATANALEPLLNKLFEVTDASRDQMAAAFDTAESWEEFQQMMQDANRVGGFFAQTTKFTNEELFNQAKAAEADAAAMAELQAEIGEVVDEEEELRKATKRSNDLLKIIQVSMRGLIGEGVEKLVEAEKELAAITDKNSDEFQKASEKANDLRDALKETTAELIFQQSAAGLSADATLQLAGALGLMDEATFVVASRAQDLRNQYDAAAFSTEEFALQTVILRDAVASLESKNIAISADTLAAEIGLRNIQSAVASIPTQKSVTISIRERLASTGPHEGRFQPFQEGGTIMLPDTGPLGDRIPVNIMAERGERIDITPRSGQAPAGGRGGNTIHVNVANEVDASFLIDILENI